MPRLSKKTAAKRNRHVPIRVLESTDPERKPLADEILESHQTTVTTKPAASINPHRGSSLLQGPNQPIRRGALVWGVGISFMLVLTVWFGAMRLMPHRTGPNSADETLSNIGRVLADFSNDFDLKIDTVNQQLDTTDSETTPQVKELQQQVFPEFYK
jgi:flagellar biosynthesis/type III secretory pathway M-ring protein FliF/YscJ